LPIVNLQTADVPNDNSFNHFRYDRSSSPAAQFGNLPEKTALVVTDIFVEPENSTATNQYLVVVDFGARSFTAKFMGPETWHYALAGAHVIPAGSTATARNLSDARPVGRQRIRAPRRVGPPARSRESRSIRRRVDHKPPRTARTWKAMLLRPGATKPLMKPTTHATFEVPSVVDE
jgi:hypothetical protein